MHVFSPEEPSKNFKPQIGFRKPFGKKLILIKQNISPNWRALY
jgi:hypothetical protein